jgi:hypothetical protein
VPTSACNGYPLRPTEFNYMHPILGGVLPFL